MIKSYIRHAAGKIFEIDTLPALQGSGTTGCVHLQVSLTPDNLKGNTTVLTLFTRQIQ